MVWVLMDLHIFLSIVALTNVYFLSIPPNPCSNIHVQNIIRYIIQVLPSLTFLQSVKFSKISLLIIWPTDVYCHYIRTIFVSVFLKFSSLLTCSVSRILRILLYNHIAVATDLHLICEETDQVLLAFRDISIT